MDARAHLQRMKEASVAERFVAAGDLLFGSDDGREFLWAHTSTLLDSDEAVLRVLRLLLRAPFAPCFHVIRHMQIFLPFGYDDPDAHLVFVDVAKAPPLVALAFCALVPHLQTRKWSPANRDSILCLAHEEIDPALWEVHRRALLDHYVARIIGSAASPASVRSILEHVLNKK